VITRLARFALWRLCAATAFTVVVASSSLLLVRFAPGDAASDLTITVADPSAPRDARARMGLDRSPLAQLGAWLVGLARLDLGTSSRFGRPVTDLLGDRVANTAVLAGLALALATLVGLPMGVVTGSRLKTPSTRFVVFLSVFLVACPPILFTLALLFLSISSGEWLPVAPGRIVLPLVALALPMAAVVERLQSQATAEALSHPHIVAAAARGVPVHRLVWLHALRPSLRSLLGVYGIIIATLFSGSVAVETMTAWPGLGRLMLDGLVSRDVYLVAGCALAGAVLIATGNLVADTLRAAIDPRVREGV